MVNDIELYIYIRIEVAYKSERKGARDSPKSVSTWVKPYYRIQYNINNKYKV